MRLQPRLFSLPGEGLRFLHECPDHNGALVCEDCEEFASCRCSFGRSNEDAEAIRDVMREDR